MTRFAFHVFLCVLLCKAPAIIAQQLSPEQLGFAGASIEHPDFGTVNYYISSNAIDQKKPVLLYLDGSGAYPLFQYTSRGIGSSVLIDFRTLSETYHVVLISKPGVPFIDSVRQDASTGYPIYPAPEEYTSRLSLDWRAGAAHHVLNALIQDYKVDMRKVAVVGISEGFQVGAKLATLNTHVTHLVLIVGNGLTQCFDFIIQNRLDAQSGKITDAEAQANIDSLNAVFNDIYAHPYATDKQWYGHTYLRWSSFCGNNPTENLMSLDIPIYLVAASNDRNTSVLGTDYLYLESIRLRKTNITYRVYPYDHGLNEFVRDAEGKIVSVTSHMQEILREGIAWLDQ